MKSPSRLPLHAAVTAVLTLAACGSTSPRETGPAPAPSAADVVIDTPEPVFRVGRAFVPARYEARLVVDPARPGFAAEVEIRGELAAPTRTVWLHAEGLDVSGAVAQQGDAEVALDVVPATRPDMTGLRARGDAALAAGDVTLHLEYAGVFVTDDARGAFVQEERGDRYVYSQFESEYARRVFPSIDEPWSKVPWQLTIDAPTEMVALSNTPVERAEALGDGMMRTTFAQTPPLPTYLVAFAVGPFEIVDGGTSRSGVPMRVITPRGRARDATYAVEVTPSILAFVEDFIGMPYPYAKLDALVIPQTTAFSAMEHPGLITYGEMYLLFDPDTVTDQQKSWYLETAAHELAHQWFGNYVTPAWWDDLWLNESLAEWIGGEALRALEPAWASSVASRSWAMSSDGLASARMIRQPVESRDDVVNAFDGITYSKGASVLRMFEAAAGEEAFRAALRRYVEAHAWGVATADDFLAAVSAELGDDTAAGMRSFVEQAGVPVVEARLACEAGDDPVVTLTQRRWLPTSLIDEQRAQRWTLPVCVVAGRGGKRDITCTTLRAATQELRLPGACPAWVLPNAGGAGYFRTALDVGQLDALEAAWDALTPGERLVIFDDAHAAARNGVLPLERVLGLVDELAREGTVDAVSQVAGLVWLADELVSDEARPRLARRVRDALGPLARRIGWQRRAGDGFAEDMLRVIAVPLAAHVGQDERLAREAVALGRRWRTLSTRERRNVLDTALAHDATLVDDLLAEARAGSDAATIGDIGYALGRVRDPGAAERVLALLLEPSTDLKTFARVIWRLAMWPRARPVVEAFVREHAASLLPRLPRELAAYSIDALTSSCDPAKREDAAAWGQVHIAPLAGGPRVLAQALETMDQCIAERPAQRAAVEAWLATPARGRAPARRSTHGKEGAKR